VGTRYARFQPFPQFDMEGATMMDVAQQPTQEELGQRAHRRAAESFRRDPDWVTFYRQILGVDGVIDQLFPTFEQRCEFEKTEEFSKIQQMLARLRERSRGQRQPDEPTRVITVRLPQSLHEALRHEAHNHKTSMNKLCISKLLQVIEDDLVPSDFHRREDEGTAEPRPQRPSFAHPQQPPPTAFQPSPPASTTGFHQPTPTPQPHFRTPKPPPSSGGAGY
jgi:predicted HicB family RNase H-like nuclease